MLISAKFYVLGTGVLDGSTTTHISNSSGGAGGAVYPTSSDNLTFDTNSSAASYTVTITGALNCLSLTIGNPASGTVTFAGTAATGIAGSFTNTGSPTWNYTGTITFTGASGYVVVPGGITFGGPIVFNRAGGEWDTSGAFASSSSVTLTAGYAEFSASSTVQIARFSSSNTNTRTLGMGSAAWSLTGSGTVWDVSTTTGLTITAGTSTITMNDATSSTKRFNGGAKTYYGLVVSGSGSGAFEFAGGFTTTSFSAATQGRTIKFEEGQDYSMANVSWNGSILDTI